ncbi:MAG TPA: shikimate kinase [Candidatus Polarisedimenticolia bacterium]|jgi:XRE family aerobic/anaerobic benzoate catabolism transcriptional regulator|nr:shikimate kinase [Candidatus Polarisedimenticolia bacterium]
MSRTRATARRSGSAAEPPVRSGEAGGAAILLAVGAAVRAARRGRGLTRRAVAARSGLSERFLAEIESGTGNVSLLRLHDLAAALEVPFVSLIGTAADAGAPDAPGRELPRIALVGLRGAGKSTIGRRLAKALHAPFVELDARIEAAAGMTIGQIFDLNGERHFRRLEREALTALSGEPGPMIVAAGGGLVTEPETWALLRSAFTTVWLSAAPEDHWTRVVAQGDRRPMAGKRHAMSELKDLLEARRLLYGQADLTIDTSRLGIGAAVQRITRRVRPGARNARAPEGPPRGRSSR